MYMVHAIILQHESESLQLNYIIPGGGHIVHFTVTIPVSTIMNQSASSGYKIWEGTHLVTPRRLGMNLGSGGEPWHMSPAGLYEMEQSIKNDVRGSVTEERALTAEQQVLVFRRLAGARAQARAGYSVDGSHQWKTTGHHSMYVTPAEARVAIATSTLEDIFDAVS
jgi:hypothetical protein